MNVTQLDNIPPSHVGAYFGACIGALVELVGIRVELGQ